MKKWVRVITLLLAVCVCLAGCSAGKNTKDSGEAVRFSQETRVADRVEDGVHIQTAVPVFAGFSAAKELNEKIKKIADDGIEEVKQAAKGLKNPNAEGHLYFMSFYDAFLNNDVLSVWVSNENYTGGAHGYRWIRSFNVNIKTGESYETPGALFKDPEAGTKLITDKIIAEIERHPEIYFPEAVQTVKDMNGKYSFYLDGHDLVVYFDLYDLAPYVAGMPLFQFPLKDLQTKLPLGGHPERGDIRLNGADIKFANKIVSNEKGEFLPLKDMAGVLSLSVVEKDGKYTVNGKAVQPMMVDGVPYMPIQYFNDVLKESKKQGFVVFDGEILRIFVNTINDDEIQMNSSTADKNPSSGASVSSAQGKTEK